MSAASEISLWAPAIAGLEVERGVSATLVRPLGELALTVLVTPDTEDALAAAATLLGQEGAAVVVENDSGDVIVEVAGAGESADLVLVAVSGVRVIIVVSLGASSGDVLEVALMHLE